MARSIARQAAMQLIYERILGGEANNASLDLVYEQLSLAQTNTPNKLEPSEEDKAYIQDILAGVSEHEQDLDRAIEKYSNGERSLTRVPRVDLSILRLSAYELYHRNDVPDNVAISEAMELASVYSEPKSGRYINGVLGAMSRNKQEG